MSFFVGNAIFMAVQSTSYMSFVPQVHKCPQGLGRTGLIGHACDKHGQGVSSPHIPQPDLNTAKLN